MSVVFQLVNRYAPHQYLNVTIWLCWERVLSGPLCSCSQASVGPVPEFLKRFPGLFRLIVGIRATTSRATQEDVSKSAESISPGDEN